MKKLLLILLLGSLSYTQNMSAQNDHLEPVESIFDEFLPDYYMMVRKVLMKGMSQQPELRFLIIPSFAVEETVAIEKEKGQYFIVHHKMQKSIWYTKKDQDKIPVLTKKVVISRSDVMLYTALFKKAINNRKYPKKAPWGNDGINYYFTVKDIRLKTGTVWSPRDGSQMDRLKKIGYSLIHLANETQVGKIAKLNLKVTQEIKRLTAEM